ncbi:replication initiation protein [Clostridium estertheticum]|uniref:replication initiation protein n=1 Tax=Clostridium estertheticum TaxID=238834 RepID=UPI001CF311E2|nr:RepB family plasmid replication initiator protein [Clostridium estertheticum]MCB2362203.1 RepB family plasmid replication initiator protein [Clostridium estertheticum]
MENKKGGDLICRRPSDIVEARFSLTKKQNDILDMVFATIENDDNLQYEIDISKYAKLYNIQDKSNVYGDVKKTVKTFEGKGFSLTQRISEKKENRIYFAWFSSINYLGGEGKIIIELGQNLKKLLLNAKKACFYQIKYPINFNNIYSKRIYYYLKSFEDTGWRIDNLDILRDKLECPKSYNIFYEFKRSVLKPAYEEINGNSDIDFKYEVIKTKGKVTAIKFYVKTNKPKISKSSKLAATPEIAATVTESEEEDVLPNIVGYAPEIATTLKPGENNNIKKVMALMKEHDITPLEAKKIYDSSKKNFNIIYKVYQDKKHTQTRSGIVGLMIKLVAPGVYMEPKNSSKGSFNDYEQRCYDFDELEKKLLGWDKAEKDATGEEYKQTKLIMELEKNATS